MQIYLARYVNSFENIYTSSTKPIGWNNLYSLQCPADWIGMLAAGRVLSGPCAAVTAFFTDGVSVGRFIDHWSDNVGNIFDSGAF